jgi:hypothetical protein
MSCTAGYASGSAGRSGVPDGNPPTEAGILSITLEEEHAESPAAAARTTAPAKFGEKTRRNRCRASQLMDNAKRTVVTED